MSNFGELPPGEAIFADEYWGETIPRNTRDVINPGRAFDRDQVSQILADTAMLTVMRTNVPRELSTGVRLNGEIEPSTPDYLWPGAIWLIDSERTGPLSPALALRLRFTEDPDEQDRAITRTDLATMIREASESRRDGQDSEVLMIHRAHFNIHSVDCTRVYFRAISFLAVMRHSRGLALHSPIFATANLQTGYTRAVLEQVHFPQFPFVIGQTYENPRDHVYSRIRGIEVCRAGSPVKEKQKVFSKLFNISPVTS